MLRQNLAANIWSPGGLRLSVVWREQHLAAVEPGEFVFILRIPPTTKLYISQ